MGVHKRSGHEDPTEHPVEASVTRILAPGVAADKKDRGQRRYHLEFIIHGIGFSEDDLCSPKC